MVLEVAEKPFGDFIGAFSHAEVLELYGLEPTIAAGVDPRKWCQVHIDVEGQSVVAAAVLHAQAEGGDLGAVDVDARSAFLAAGVEAEVGNAVDDRLFEQIDHFAHLEVAAV